MTVKEIFDRGAAKYDGQRRKVIPCFDDFYECVISLIPFTNEDPFAGLDLGGGTGLLTWLILNKFPKAQLTVLDVSEKMLKKAKERFKGNRQVCFSVMDYAMSPLPGEFDLVVSAMSIHHLFDAEKRRLFQRLFDCLRPGGVFIHAEIAKGATDYSEDLCKRMWLDHLQKSDLTKEQLSVILERMSYDRTTPLQTQLDWLTEAGFEDVDCYYKYYNFAVYAGRKLRGISNGC
ncbi:MAG: class I SAM-dependent methyltransferase [Deltaproteobacteria bacterium]|nr:class I SAM-dependent methyltransferase [Deltaproteobacteria bacterium]